MRKIESCETVCLGVMGRNLCPMQPPDHVLKTSPVSGPLQEKTCGIDSSSVGGGSDMQR